MHSLSVKLGAQGRLANFWQCTDGFSITYNTHENKRQTYLGSHKSKRTRCIKFLLGGAITDCNGSPIHRKGETIWKSTSLWDS